VAFSQTVLTEDLKKITVPVLAMRGDDDQIVPYADSGPCPPTSYRTAREDIRGIPARYADDAGANDQP
jgi:non-heme chloroperoxidase